MYLRVGVKCRQIRFRLRFRQSAPFSAKNVLCLTVRVRIVVAGAGRSVQTESDGLPECFPHSCSDSRNRSRKLNLPALYAYPYTAEASSKEPDVTRKKPLMWTSLALRPLQFSGRRIESAADKKSPSSADLEKFTCHSTRDYTTHLLWNPKIITSFTTARDWYLF
jgi:hypothetical protein